MRAISLALLFMLSAAACAVDSDSPIGSNELSLGGVAIGDSEAAVVSALGQVLRTEHPDNYLTVQLESDGLIVLLDPQEGVGEISSERPQHCTRSGVCPGMSFDKIPKAFGRPSITDQDSSSFLAQYATDTDCWIALSVNAGRVESVRIACPV